VELEFGHRIVAFREDRPEMLEGMRQGIGLSAGGGLTPGQETSAQFGQMQAQALEEMMEGVGCVGQVQFTVAGRDGCACNPERKQARQVERSEGVTREHLRDKNGEGGATTAAVEKPFV
jgi:hypothetical protein